MPTTRARRTTTRRAAAWTTLLVVVLLLTGGLATPAPAQAAARRWAPAATATIHPGVLVRTPIGSCTANFVFSQGDDLYLGTASHCVGQGEATNLNGCAVPVLPLGTPVAIEGATKAGRLAYASWGAMQAAGEDDLVTCHGNDFALVRIDPADHGRVNPSVPHWGGPTGIRPDGLPPLAGVRSYGRSFLKGETPVLRPMVGLSLGTQLGGWQHLVYQVLPGVPGDSGGPTLDTAGRATGVLSALGLAPLPGSNLMTAVHPAFHYARAHGLPHLRLEVGTEPFNPNQLPLG